MQLKINMAYKVKDGNILIPRSHWGDEKGAKYAIFEKIKYIDGGTKYEVKHIPMSLRQIKEAFALGKSEKVEIV